MTRTLAVVSMAAAVTLLPALAAAQVAPPPGGQRHRMEMEQRLHAGFGQMVQNRLGLGREKVAALQGVMMAFQQDRMELNQARATVRFRLREQALQRMPEAEARALLEEMVRLQEREVDLYRREQEELLKVLTPLQLVRFYGLRESLGQQVQEIRQGRGLGRGPGGGGLGGVGPGGIIGEPGGMGPLETPPSAPGWRRFLR
jgi:Spy/CpxP family protein refolding chaperone